MLAVQNLQYCKKYRQTCFNALPYTTPLIWFNDIAYINRY